MSEKLEFIYYLKKVKINDVLLTLCVVLMTYTIFYSKLEEEKKLQKEICTDFRDVQRTTYLSCPYDMLSSETFVLIYLFIENVFIKIHHHYVLKYFGKSFIYRYVSIKILRKQGPDDNVFFLYLCFLRPYGMPPLLCHI